MSNYLKLELDEIYTLALKFPEPRAARDGFNGEKQVRWLLSDGALYTAEDFAGKLAALKLKPGERFQVVRTREGGAVVTKVFPMAVKEQARAAAKEIRPPVRKQAAAQLLDGVGSLDAAVEFVPPKLEGALKTAVSAAAKAEAEGLKIGYPVRFTASDISKMAITLYGAAHA